MDAGRLSLCGEESFGTGNECTVPRHIKRTLTLTMDTFVDADKNLLKRTQYAILCHYTSMGPKVLEKGFSDY